MRIRNNNEENFELPLVPMIDMMLVLLIFFMVATTLKVTQSEIPVELPDSAASLAVREEPNVLVIGLDKAGNKYIDGVLTTTEELHTRLREAATQNAAQPVRLDIDRGLSFDRVIEVLDLCEFEGLKNIGFHTRAPDAQRN
jgi:biopolymer transport protein ExbD